MTITRRIVTGVLFIVLALLAYFAYVLNYSNGVVDDLRVLNNDELVTLNAAWEMRWLDEALTHSAARFIDSDGDPVWRQRYDRHVVQLDRAISEAKAKAKPDDFKLFTSVDQANLALVAYESEIFELVALGRVDEARDVLNGSYASSKLVYQDGLDSFFEAQRARTSASFERRLAVAKSSRTTATVVLAAIIALIVLFSGELLWRIIARVRRLTGSAKAMAAGDLDARSDVGGNDEIGELAIAFNEMSETMARVVHQLRSEARRDGFSGQLSEAFEMPDSEAELYQVVERAMENAAREAPMELLLADSSLANLERVAISPSGGAPGCPVGSPWSCPAVRRGSAMHFESSDALNACPHLRGRPSGPRSAVCMPVTFMGKALGVLHATNVDGTLVAPEEAERMTILAGQAGTRLGTMRAFHRNEVQASTDSLTGLLNRRAFEDQTLALTQRGEPFAVVVADLDHFKGLNDTFGHHAGDRALSVFAAALRATVRARDIVSRYGGDEFAIVLPGLDAAGAVEVTHRLRQALTTSSGIGEVPSFTASFGVADSSSAATLEAILRAADGALFEAKDQGRDRVVIHNPATHDLRPKAA